MSQILDSVKKVALIMRDIATASQEQSTGIQEINRAVSMTDDGTQQNAALVEQAAAAAQSLQDQANALSKVVGQFKL
ncbi:methyl-accepting chemotaxis (MCP) signaling domain protein [Collimonas fungivorans]|uniref:Methyl-accepting chemotaxis (MCP) signaling domain protein n=1 Tax=Collimonas fungivorans TaxID=158899 RepID=A0A127P685_9BURK|nr:methyl-accepting chemotaxis (MCP) signaling domain protein [Collimonas fungivorans]